MKRTTDPPPTTPPLPILASYWNCPCTFEQKTSVGFQDIFDTTPQPFTWKKEEGVIDGLLLTALGRENIRNVQLQLRPLDSLTDEEARACFRLAMKHHKKQPNKIERYPDGIKITDGIEYETCLSMELDDEGQLLTSADSEFYNHKTPALFMSAALLNYLRSIQIDIDGLGVARKEGARG